MRDDKFNKVAYVLIIIFFVGLLFFIANKADASPAPDDTLVQAVKGSDTAAALEAIKNGADVNAKYNNGASALTFAALHGDVLMVILLLDRGADINAINDFGQTALMYVSTIGQTHIVEVLLWRGADAKMKDEDGSTALLFAFTRNHLDVVRLLENHLDK